VALNKILPSDLARTAPTTRKTHPSLDHPLKPIYTIGIFKGCTMEFIDIFKPVDLVIDLIYWRGFRDGAMIVGGICVLWMFSQLRRQ